MKKWHNAYIRWFDNYSGVGIVTVPEYGDIKLHYSAALYDYKWNKSLSHRKSKKNFITFQNLDIVQVQIHEDYTWSQVVKIRLSRWTTREDLLSDNLLRFLENYTTYDCSQYWTDHCLNNLICAVLK